MKKTLKRIAVTILLTPFVLLALGFVAYLLYALFSIGGESTRHQVYLRQHMQEIQHGAETSFQLFDQDFYQSKVIMLGEVHGFAAPQELDFQLLQHLNQKTGLTHYLAEVDYSQAYFLNQYLLTGDESLLDYVFQTWVEYNAQWANQELYNKIRNIHTLNQRLPAADRIQIVGVDRIQDVRVTKRHLQRLLQEANHKPGTHSALDTLEMLVADSAQASELQAFATRHTANPETLTPYLPQPLQTDLQHVLTNLQYQHNNVKRDSVMFLNLVHLTKVNKWENEQFYGMWGLMHTLQNSVNEGYTSFAAILKKEDSPFKGKVTSINIMATDSENMIPAASMPPALHKGQAYINTTWVNSDGPLAFVAGIKDLKAVTRPHTTSLFKVDSEASPYRTSSLLAQTNILLLGQGIAPDSPNPTITQACQYIVLIRNSKAATPIEATL
ncbi:TraB/GumN family protein [Pontibacter roseus]|uniref:hypothetical protein n=1 Tax=Pontibacter roseus TaxID=336989 RepID=UPI0003760C6D|nr:hypothetical protein [Pontibacter roseus]